MEHSLNKSLYMRILVSFFIFMGFTCPCLAKVDLKSTKRLVIPVDNVTPKITSEDVAKVIPTSGIPSGASESEIMTRVVDRTVNMWFNSPAIKNSIVGRAVEQTQEKLKTDVEVKPSTPEGVTHKFSVKIEAFQALAKVEYRGWMNAIVNYDAKASATDFELSEKVFDNKKLIVSHKANKDQDLSMIGLAWSW